MIIGIVVYHAFRLKQSQRKDVNVENAVNNLLILRSKKSSKSTS